MRNRKWWFDSITIYRLSGSLLAVVFVWGIIRRLLDTGRLPFSAMLILFWAGFLLLMANLVRDAVHEIRARRQVKKLITARIHEGK